VSRRAVVHPWGRGKGLGCDRSLRSGYIRHGALIAHEEMERVRRDGVGACRSAGTGAGRTSENGQRCSRCTRSTSASSWAPSGRTRRPDAGRQSGKRWGTSIAA